MTEAYYKDESYEENKAKDQEYLWNILSNNMLYDKGGSGGVNKGNCKR